METDNVKTLKKKTGTEVSPDKCYRYVRPLLPLHPPTRWPVFCRTRHLLPSPEGLVRTHVIALHSDSPGCSGVVG